MLRSELKRRRTSRAWSRWVSWGRRFALLPALGTLTASFLYTAVVSIQGAESILHPEPYHFPDRPENYGLSYEVVEFASAVDGIRIAGWLFADPKRQRRLVIVVPGIRSHKAHLLREYTFWLAHEFGVLAIDPRGTGESGAAAGSFGADERRDVAAAVAFAMAHGYRNIGLFGSSTGGAAAISEGAYDRNVRAIVSDGAPASISEGIADYLMGKGFWLPWWCSQSILGTIWLRLGHPPAQGEAIRHIARVAPRPLLLIHGTDDRVIPPIHLERLSLAADPTHTAVLRFQNADHVSNMVRSPHRLYKAAYEGAVLELFRRTLEPP